MTKKAFNIFFCQDLDKIALSQKKVRNGQVRLGKTKV